MKPGKLLTFLLILAAVGAAQEHFRSPAGETLPTHVAWPDPAADKVSPLILFHRSVKAGEVRSSDGRPIEPRVLGIGGTAPDREECALYVRERLDRPAIDALTGLGISVNPDIWVEALPGRHPFGFHLATVDYASLDIVRSDPRFVRLESAETLAYPMNDQSLVKIKADLVHAGTGVAARTGAGISIAIADSGLDFAHPDIPVPVERFDMTTGTVAPPAPAGQTAWTTNVANVSTMHGTHVTGSAIGRGTASGGTYKGAAPAASLNFYKIGNSLPPGSAGAGSASTADMVEAITRARAQGCRIFSMSYGGLDTYLDGSDSPCQAVDAATFAGMTSFIAAGNEADDHVHASKVVGPGTTSAVFKLDVANATAGVVAVAELIQVIWRDNNPYDANIVLSCANLAAGEALVPVVATSASPRGTQSRQYGLLGNALLPGAAKAYDLRLQNTAAGGLTPKVHCFRAVGAGVFRSAGIGAASDPTSTVKNPAVADTAIAVGAYKQRTAWTDYQGNNQDYATLSGDSTGNTADIRAGFSNRGPRLDGVRKPEILAPGAATISVRDLALGNAFYNGSGSMIIDDDGLGQAAANTLGNARYMVAWGTSMACPIAAGAAALLLEASPTLTPWDVRTLLTSTAALAANPNDDDGYGLIDIRAAIQAIPAGGHTPFVFIGSTSGGGTGDGYVRLHNVPAGTVEGYTLFSFDTSQPVGSGWLVGIVPDSLTWTIITMPAAPGNFFRWTYPAIPGQTFPDTAMLFPAGTFATLAGVSIDGMAVAVGPGPSLLGMTAVIRDTF